MTSEKVLYAGICGVLFEILIMLIGLFIWHRPEPFEMKWPDDDPSDRT